MQYFREINLFDMKYMYNHICILF